MSVVVAILFAGVGAVGVITVVSAVFGIKTKQDPETVRWEREWPSDS
jgi:hypothetical protein